MGNKTNIENWAARERLRMIELLLWWRGWVGRGDLGRIFGISAAQASGDLQRYLQLNGTEIVYHTSRKRYEASPEMKCAMQKPVFEEALSYFFGLHEWTPVRHMTSEGTDQVDVLSLPARGADNQVERAIIMAAVEGLVCRVSYLSVNSGKKSWRKIAPSAFGWDGRRWHVRAYCLENKDWRDFVLGRMVKVDWPEEEAGELPADADWESIEEVSLKLNPKLKKDQVEALRLDYGLKGDSLKIKVRKAMKSYLLAEMFLDDGRDLPKHFVQG